jgi:phosphatidylinositol alpha-mannosyltransferase
MSNYDSPGNPHYGGGGAVVVHEVASRLARDYEVVVYCAGYRGSGPERPGSVRYVFLPVGWAGPRGGQLVFQLLLFFVAMREHADMWIETFTPPVSASLLPIAFRGPVIGLVQMLSAADMTRRYKLPFQVIERRALRLYRNLIVLNEADRVTVRRYNRSARCLLIPNGAYRPEVPDEEFGQGAHLLFIGRIDVEQKGLDLLLRALSRHPAGLPLMIAGSGSRRDENRLRALADQTQVPVELVGRVGGQEKDRLLRQAACVVVPSRYETFCLSALEAMTYGKPVVCFDLPQLRWISAGGAVRVPVGDVDALGRAVRDLVADPARRQRLGRVAFEASQAYDWEVIGDRYRGAVESTID